jgi:hypothetical protein
VLGLGGIQNSLSDIDSNTSETVTILEAILADQVGEPSFLAAIAALEASLATLDASVAASAISITSAITASTASIIAAQTANNTALISAINSNAVTTNTYLDDILEVTNEISADLTLSNSYLNSISNSNLTISSGLSSLTNLLVTGAGNSVFKDYNSESVFKHYDAMGNPDRSVFKANGPFSAKLSVFQTMNNTSGASQSVFQGNQIPAQSLANLVDAVSAVGVPSSTTVLNVQT